MNLDEALQECTLALLRKIAASHQIPTVEETLRAEIAAQISGRLRDAAYLREFSARLPDEQGEVLRFLASHDWTGRAFLLERQFTARSSETADPPMSPCLSLLQQGLIYRSFGTIGTWRGELYHVPDELRAPILSSLPAESFPPALDVRATSEPALVGQRNTPFDFFCLLSFLRRAERRAYQGFLSRFDLPKLEQEAGASASDTAGDGAEKRWRFLVHLGLAGGWVRRDGNLLTVGRSATQLLSGEQDAVRRRIVDRYLKDRSWSDLAEAGRVRQSLGSRRVDEASGRQLLLHHLRELGGSDWVSEDSFCEALRLTNPDFLREDYASLSWAMVDIAADAEVYGPDSWDLVEGEWIRYVLRGPLYWLGVVRWGWRADGARLAFQLVPEPEESGKAQPLPSSSRQAEFVENHGLTVSSDADLRLVLQLEPYLVLRGREQSTSSYRFTRASVARGMEMGGSWGELSELLEQLGYPPRQLLAQLEEWAASYGLVVLQGSIVLTTATDEEAESVLSTPGVSLCMKERLGPRSYRVIPERLWQLVQALKEAGKTPRVDPSTGLQRARIAAGDLPTMQESLFAIQLLRQLHGGLEMENAADAQRRLEATLGPDSIEEVSRRVQETVRRMRTRGESGW